MAPSVSEFTDITVRLLNPSNVKPTSLFFVSFCLFWYVFHQNTTIFILVATL